MQIRVLLQNLNIFFNNLYCKFMIESKKYLAPQGIEPRPSGCNAEMLPLHHGADI